MSHKSVDDEATDVASGTRLESAEEIRKAHKARRTPTVKEMLPDVGTASFRPSSRPPLALLCILDDGAGEGEWVRLRKDKTVIGRVDGDIVIHHDAMMSGRHAEISRTADKGRYRWHLTDLQSTNGTFVRVADSMLKPGQEMLIGGRRYRFDSAAPTENRAVHNEAVTVTRDWQNVGPSEDHPSLVEVTPQGDGRRFLLDKPENWIGRDPQRCTVVITDDALVSQRHVRLYRDAKDNWHVENAKALNGTWLRVNRIQLESTGHFQLGEQRFVVRIP